MSLNAEILEVSGDSHRHIVSVRFTGMLREEADAAPVAIDEIWHLTKPIHGQGGWVLSGIQQIQSSFGTPSHLPPGVSLAPELCHTARGFFMSVQKLFAVLLSGLLERSLFKQHFFPHILIHRVEIAGWGFCPGIACFS